MDQTDNGRHRKRKALSKMGKRQCATPLRTCYIHPLPATGAAPALGRHPFLIAIGTLPTHAFQDRIDRK